VTESAINHAKQGPIQSSILHVLLRMKV
jgi:hypothetical protein